MACPDCASTATTRRKGRTALGYRRFRCQACRRRFNERTGTPHLQRSAVPNGHRAARRALASPLQAGVGRQYSIRL